MIPQVLSARPQQEARGRGESAHLLAPLGSRWEQRVGVGLEGQQAICRMLNFLLSEKGLMSYSSRKSVLNKRQRSFGPGLGNEGSQGN